MLVGHLCRTASSNLLHDPRCAGHNGRFTTFAALPSVPHMSQSTMKVSVTSINEHVYRRPTSEHSDRACTTLVTNIS